MMNLTDYLDSKKNPFLDEDEKLCPCGNILKSDEEINLKICKECK